MDKEFNRHSFTNKVILTLSVFVVFFSITFYVGWLALEAILIMVSMALLSILIVTMRRLNAIDSQFEHHLSDHKKSNNDTSKRLDFALLMARQGWFDLNVKTKDVIVSDNYAALLGFNNSEFSPSFQDWLENIHPDDKQAVLSEFDACLHSNKSHEIEYRRKSSRGDWIWLHSISEVVERDDSGQPIRIIGLHRDVTKRKQNQLMLVESETRLKQAQSFANIAYWDLDENETDIIWSQQIYKLLGLSEQSDIKPEHYLYQMSDEGKKESFFDWIKLNFPQNEELFIEYKVNRISDDQERWFECRARVIAKNNDYESQKISGFIQDITERKLTEIQLRESQNLLHTIIDSAPIHIFWKDTQLNYLGCNRSFADMAKLNTTTDIIGRDDYDLAWSHNAEYFRQGDLEIIQTKFPNRSFEQKITDEDGGIKWFRTSKVPIKDQNDHVFGVLGVSEDITQRKLADKNMQLLFRVYLESHEGLLITDPSKVITDVNPALCEITGYKEQELLGKNVNIMLTEENDTDFQASMWTKIDEHGYWQGELNNRKQSGELYVELLTVTAMTDEYSEISNYVFAMTDITESKKQQEKLELLTHYDSLTKLPNRILFIDRFNQAIAHSNREKKSLAICFLDLDDFKPVNDQYGHEVGDKLLIEAARRITTHIRDEDTVTRQAGDEFSILLGNLESLSQCEQTIDRIHHALRQPFYIDGTEFQLTASSGMTLYPADDSDLDTLLRHADQAMYQAKLAGKNRYHLFNAFQNQEVVNKQHRLLEIEQALAGNQFALYYQPKVNMVTGKVYGAEALIRWNHPEKGLVPPLDFLPIVEGTELDIKIGQWVIEQALADMTQWQASNIKLEISVNISSMQLQDSSFIEQLMEILGKYPSIKSKYLQLEILESSVLGDLKSVNRIIKVCQETVGVSVALDDFGTGYSSLTHLRNLPVNKLKIDQSFVKNILDLPSDYAIVDGVIGLADAFNSPVIAEGVESENHGLLLMMMGCDEAQGYFIAKPMPVELLLGWLSSYQPNLTWIEYAAEQRTIRQSKVNFLKLTSQQWLKFFSRGINSEPKELEVWPIMEHKHCHCGAWIQRAKREQLFNTQWLAKLDIAHRKGHAAAKELLHIYQQGDVKQARQRLTEVESAFDEMQILFPMYH